MLCLEKVKYGLVALIRTIVLLALTGSTMRCFAQSNDTTIQFMKHSLSIPASVQSELTDTLGEQEYWRFVIGKDTIVMIAENYFYEPPLTSEWRCGTGDLSWSECARYGPGFCIPRFQELPAMSYPIDTAGIAREEKIKQYNLYEMQRLLFAKEVLLKDMKSNSYPYEFEQAAFAEMYKIVATYEAGSFKQDTITLSAEYTNHDARFEYAYQRDYTYGAFSRQYILFYGTIRNVSTLGVLNEMLKTLVFTVDDSAHRK